MIGQAGESVRAVLFPGQGAQFVGMAGEWCDAAPRGRALFEKASSFLGYDLEAVCRSGPRERLDTTAVSQPAILVTSLAALEWLRGRPDSPLGEVVMTAGLSLGEYSALVFAGALSFDDALRVVAERGRAMQDCAEASPGGMVAVLGLERRQLTDMCAELRREGEELSVANVLCPGNIVVSGSREACDRLAAEAAGAGALKCVRLEVAGAFHTPLMQPAVERLKAILAETEIHRPRIPVVSNVDALPHDDPAEIRELLARQVCGVVEWQRSVEYMLSRGLTEAWEVGPGRVLRGLLKRIDRRLPCHGAPD
jgi:[acyl-carrier-protein] S-malonyltransferase